MEKPLETLYVKRTQKDHSLSLKLQIVKEIESAVIWALLKVSKNMQYNPVLRL